LLDHLKHFARRFAKFLAELDVFPLLKLRHSRFPLLPDSYPSQRWFYFWMHCTHAAASCWDERRMYTAPSRGSTYPLYCITAPLCSQSVKLLTVLCRY
jgi:hypothetical protein